MNGYKTYTQSEIIEFVNQYLGQNRIKGDEITLANCPYCGRSKKFNINIESGLFRCWHSDCNTTGGIAKLVKDFGSGGEKMDKKTYEKPEKKINLSEEIKKIKFTKLTDEYLQYFLKRGITKETLDKCKVMLNGNRIAFGYKVGEKIIAVKYRTIDKQLSSETGSKTTLWNADAIDITKPWIICEGEIDHMSFMECGLTNVTSVSHGANSLDWIEAFYDKLNNCKEIILAFDCDKVGELAVRSILKRLDASKIKIMTYRGEKDCNDLYVKHGKDAVTQEYNNAQPYNLEGLYNAGEISDEYKPERIKSGFECFNRSIGGFVMGGITVITGTPGSGKSTIISQMVLDTTEQNEKTYIYTGELRKEVYMQWLLLQACRIQDTESVKCEVREKVEHRAKKEKVNKIKGWLNEKVYLFEKERAATEDELFESMIFAYKKHGIKLFIIDNLMKVKFKHTANGKFDSQYQFVDALKSFANNYNVHVILVAHPKKPESGSKITNIYEISGASEIVNLSDNVITMHRYTEKELNEREELKEKGVTTNLSIFKNREFGDMTANIHLCFDWRNRRFKEVDEHEKTYGWEDEYGF